MATPADRGWGHPGRRHGDAQAREYGRHHITTIETADGSRFSVREEVAPILLGFLNEIIANGYRIKGKILDDWGWYVRPIAGSNRLSNHSWGLAVDVNALTNPQGRKLTTDMPDFVPEAARRWGLRWGGTYASQPDAMHFEWLGSRDDALRFMQDLRTLDTREDLLMAAALNDDDARRCLIRQWYAEFLGRGFNDASEQQAQLEVFRTKGADLCLAGIVDSAEARAYRSKTPDTR